MFGKKKSKKIDQVNNSAAEQQISESKPIEEN